MRVEVVTLVIAVLFLTACDPNAIDEKVNQTKFKDYSKIDPITGENITLNVTSNKTIVYEEEYVPTFNQTLSIASFNAQIFGVTKMDNAPVIKAMANILDKYNIFAFQEIRDASQTSFPKFMRENMPYHSYIISERLGRTTSKEQYAFAYNDFVTVTEPLVFNDVNDVFEREPYMAKFQVEDFDFVLIQIHTKPTDASEEIRHLEGVVDFARAYYGDNDIFILGDLNSDCDYYSDGTYLTDYTWLIDESEDTTTGLSHCAYDRIIDTGNHEKMILDCGVDDMVEELSYNNELKQAVSDHFPIYCELSI